MTRRGLITLGGYQFPTDPRTYESYVWPKRMSVHETLGGGVKVQDFGLHAVDLRLELASGDNYIDTTMVRALDSLYAYPNGRYTLIDWLGNEITVYFVSTGGSPGFQPTHAQIADFWRYTMHLRASAITKWHGAAYGGI